MSSTISPRAPNAATLVVTYDTDAGPVVILTRRPASMRRHPGQIAFPGGMIEPSDPSPLSAALREAFEEIGLHVPALIDAAALPQVGTLSSDIVIQPFWVHVAAVPRLQPAADEVEAILLVPLAELMAPEMLTTIEHPRRPGARTEAIHWRGEIIWGATLTTLRDLLRVFSGYNRSSDNPGD